MTFELRCAQMQSSEGSGGFVTRFVLSTVMESGTCRKAAEHLLSVLRYTLNILKDFLSFTF